MHGAHRSPVDPRGDPVPDLEARGQAINRLDPGQFATTIALSALAVAAVHVATKPPMKVEWLESCLVIQRRAASPALRREQAAECLDFARSLAGRDRGARAKAAGYLAASAAAEDASDRARARKLFDLTVRPLLGRDALARFDVPTLRALAEAVVNHAFFTNEPADALALERVYRALAGRGAASSGLGTEAFDRLVAAREFERARALAREFPGAAAEPLPELAPGESPSDAPQVLTLSPDGRTMRLQSVALDQGPRIVAVTSPLCGFSRAALEQLEADAELGPVLEKHALFVLPQGRLEARALSEWNRAHPRFSSSILYRSARWPGIDDAATPTFYFLKDGRVEDVVRGWPRRPEAAASKRAAVSEALRKIGLL